MNRTTEKRESTEAKRWRLSDLRLPPSAFRLSSLFGRVLLTTVFLWAGAAKLRGPHLFATDIAAFRLLPAAAVPGFTLGLAYYLPWLEIVCAVGLWVGRWRAAALAVGMTLLAGFTVALGSAAARGIALDCGCFGPGAATTLAAASSEAAAAGGTHLPLAVGRNLFLLGLCVFLWRQEQTRIRQNGAGVPNVMV